MSHNNWDQIEQIIDQALDLPEEERKEFIDTHCEGKPKLKGEVTQLLESIFDSEGWLENPEDYKRNVYEEISDDVQLLSTQSSLIGTQVGSYLIEEQIGEGGMGTVYLAKHASEEIEHQVAIKIIQTGKATEENIRRFKKEQQILAGLHHPSIARLYDVGTTEDGFPYIIMEYVNGTPVDSYCKKHNCSIDQKLNIFINILEAVRYAHENLVIHRDLKPGNIFIDNSGNVKILDFGISKLIKDNEDQSLTKTGVRLLTPHYAAPEQVRQENITTATDLYALGVIFYRLLSGAPPLDFSELSRYEIEQEIVNTKAPKPSSKVSDHKVRKRLKGDLDAIALKAIRKEPEHRYRVANEFLEDLKNYYEGKPVSACEDSFSYRSQKFFKRHKKSVAITACLIFVIMGLTSFYTWRITQERDQAKIEAQKAKNTKEILINIFKANDPISGDAETASLPKLLENGTQNVLQRNLDPEVKIELLFTLSTIYQNISNFDKARELVDTTLKLNHKYFGPNSINTAKSHIKLGGIAYDLGNYEEGKTELLKSKKILAARNTSSPVYSKLYHHLGFVEEGMSNYDSSRVYFQKAYDNVIQQTPVDTALYIDIIKSLGRSTHREGDHKTADSLMFKALKTSEHFNGENDVVTASIAGDIGLYYMTRAKYDSSRIYYQKSLDIKHKLYEEDPHPNLSATLTNLGVLESYVGNNTAAESLFTKALAIDTNLYGNDHPYVAFSKGHLASIYLDQNQFDKAKQLRKEQLVIYKNNYKPNHYNMAGFYRSYGNLFSATNEYQKADSYYRKSESIYSDYISKKEDTFAKLYEDWALNDYKMERYKKAIEKFKTASDTFIPSEYDEYKIRGVKCIVNIVKSHVALNQNAKAKAVLKELKSRIDTTKILTKKKEVQKLYSEAYNNIF